MHFSIFLQQSSASCKLQLKQLRERERERERNHSSLMALDPQTVDNISEDDYIDMEVSSCSNFFSNSITSPREFEFQMSSTTKERDHPMMTTSPADELFYKGKLLPLHLPPRLQMVEKLLLQNSKPNFSSFDMIRNKAEAEAETETFVDEFYSTPLMTTAPTPTTTSTPFESCNISPSESFRISRELNTEEYMNEFFSTEFSGFINENPKKSWTKKLKQSSLGSKLKASRAYLKSWFGKSGCSDESSTASKNVAEKKPFGQNEKEKCQTSSSAISRSFKKEKKTIMSTTEVESGGRHRRSFSLAPRRHSTNKFSSSSSSSSSSSCSSSSSFSSSSNSNGINNQALKCLKRCGSANYSEIESSIQGAIAHCKQSQFLSKRAASNDQVGHHFSLSASRIGVCEEQERPDELCRGWWEKRERENKSKVQTFLLLFFLTWLWCVFFFFLYFINLVESYA